MARALPLYIVPAESGAKRESELKLLATVNSFVMVSLVLWNIKTLYVQTIVCSIGNLCPAQGIASLRAKYSVGNNGIAIVYAARAYCA